MKALILYFVFQACVDFNIAEREEHYKKAMDSYRSSLDNYKVCFFLAHMSAFTKSMNFYFQSLVSTGNIIWC